MDWQLRPTTHTLYVAHTVVKVTQALTVHADAGGTAELGCKQGGTI